MTGPKIVRDTRDLPPIARAECPYDDCDWSVRHEGLGTTEDAILGAEERAVAHYEREHCGTARVLVALDCEMHVEPDQSLQDVVDKCHEEFEDRDVGAWELAYAGGEWTEQPVRTEDTDA